MRKAFTLIELLVVVLIIGILAAIAVPQYTKAVDKSRISALVIMAKAAKDAQDRYFLQQGDYSDDWEALDIALPSGQVQYACVEGGRNTNCVRITDKQFCSLRSSEGYTYCHITNEPSLQYGIRLSTAAKNNHRCISKT